MQSPINELIIVQLEPVHAEVVLAILGGVAGHAKVTLVVNKRLAGLSELAPLVSEKRLVTVSEPKSRPVRKVLRRLVVPSLGRYLHGLLLVRRHIRRRNATTVIMVTIASAAKARLVRTVLPAGRVVHLCHNPDRFRRRAQNTLHRFRANVVLSHDVYRHELKRARSMRLPKLSWYSPVTFPDALLPDASRVTAESDQAMIAIPGGVDFTRRNYAGLLRTVEQHAQLFRTARVRFVIVGKTPALFDRHVQSLEIADILLTRRGFWSFRDMFSMIYRCDLVAFLVDATVARCQEYNVSKISGTSVLAIAGNKPVLASRDFAVDALLGDQVVWYDSDKIEQVAEKYRDGRIRRERLAHMTMDETTHRAFLLQQRESLLKLIARDARATN